MSSTCEPALRVIPDLADESLVVLDVTLNDHVNEQIQQILDVCPGQLAPTGTLFDQQHQLLECQLRTGGVYAGYRTWMPGVHISEIVERLLRTQLREENTIRLHPQARLQQLFRGYSRKTLAILAVEKPHVIDVPVENQL